MNKTTFALYTIFYLTALNLRISELKLLMQEKYGNKILGKRLGKCSIGADILKYSQKKTNPKP